MIYPDMLSGVRERLEDTDFRQAGCAIAYRAMCAVADRGELPIFTSTVREIHARGHYRAGVIADLALWASNVMTSAHLRWNVLNVLRASQRRRLMDAGGSVVTRAVDPQLDADAAVDAAQEIVSGVRRLHHSTPTLHDPESYATLAAELTATRAEGTEDGLPTGLLDLDDCLSGGLRPGQLVVVGARPGMGKSAMLRDFARSFAKRGPVLFVSNEMSLSQLIDRDLAVLSGVPLNRLPRPRYWSELEREAVFRAENNLAFTPIHTIADSGLTTAKMRLVASEAHARENLKAVVVDYLQRIPDPGKDSLARVGHAIRALKSLAMELQVPVVVGSQLNRGTENRPDNRPNLADLRESGEIEQEGDVVLLLHRPGYYDTSKGDEAEIIVAKNRQGPSGTTIKALWCGPLATFRNKAR